MEYEIKNWDKFQQYKDGRPMQWIKLHVALLDSYNFDELSELDQLNIIKLWLFAAKSDGKFKGSEKFIARKIGATKLNINNLLHAGFIVRTDSYENVPREEEKRGDKKRGEEIMSSKLDDAKKAIDFLNKKTSSHFKHVASHTTLIIARLDEGHTLLEVFGVITTKTKEWMGTDMEKFLRPATLFNAEKFNQYVGVVGRVSADDKELSEWLGESNVIEGEFA